MNAKLCIPPAVNGARVLATPGEARGREASEYMDDESRGRDNMVTRTKEMEDVNSLALALGCFIESQCQRCVVAQLKA